MRQYIPNRFYCFRFSGFLDFIVQPIRFMQVLKFGGSSVANAENIGKVLRIVEDKAAGGKTIVVVSALGGITDLFLECCRLASEGNERYREKLQEAEQRHLQTARELIPPDRQSGVLSQVKTFFNEIDDTCKGIFLLGELSERTKDRVVSYGELLSSFIISSAMAIRQSGTIWADSRKLITTDSRYGNAGVDFETTDRQVRHFFETEGAKLSVMPGFIASDSRGITTTLGRGGSDYTAAIVAAALDARLLEIWTDVSGMMTADPRVVPNVRIIPEISYQEAMELSHFGAKVIYPPTIQPVRAKGIPTWIKNTFAPEDPGTVIRAVNRSSESSISGISSINSIALLNLEGSGMVGIPGFSKRLFEAIASRSINVILITQSSSEHSISVAIDHQHAEEARSAIDAMFSFEISTGKVNPIRVERDLAIVAVVGENMRSHTGVSGKMFAALGHNGINVRAIAQGSSEMNISAVIASADVKKAINVLHEAFFESAFREINLFIAGIGNVGTRLLQQLHNQQRYLREQLRVQINLVGAINSRFMLIDEQGLSPEKLSDAMQKGESANLGRFVDNIIERNLRNSVFVDITASELVPALYPQLLRKCVAVVACNKIACSSPYAFYALLKQLAAEFGTDFFFETNVGASLPVISTLNDLLRSGDRVHKIEAVLSGTLNFVFNRYDGSRSFASVVRDAQEGGYTEPDPRLDLSGQDVARKIMILVREAGHTIEMEEVENTAFMPAACMQGSVEDFYHSLEAHENHFRALYRSAAEAGKKLKFVARFENGKASVGLQHIAAEHDFYHLYGKDNIVLFHTDRYAEYPLVIKGAGAGADVTASGIFADILRTVR